MDRALACVGWNRVSETYFAQRARGPCGKSRAILRYVFSDQKRWTQKRHVRWPQKGPVHWRGHWHSLSSPGLCTHRPPFSQLRLGHLRWISHFKPVYSCKQTQIWIELTITRYVSFSLSGRIPVGSGTLLRSPFCLYSRSKCRRWSRRHRRREYHRSPPHSERPQGVGRPAARAGRLGTAAGRTLWEEAHLPLPHAQTYPEVHLQQKAWRNFPKWAIGGRDLEFIFTALHRKQPCTLPSLHTFCKVRVVFHVNIEGYRGHYRVHCNRIVRNTLWQFLKHRRCNVKKGKIGWTVQEEGALRF